MDTTSGPTNGEGSPDDGPRRGGGLGSQVALAGLLLVLALVLYGGWSVLSVQTWVVAPTREVRGEAGSDRLVVTAERSACETEPLRLQIRRQDSTRVELRIEEYAPNDCADGVEPVDLQVDLDRPLGDRTVAIVQPSGDVLECSTDPDPALVDARCSLGSTPS
ncbi:MAG: hypothetical protein R2705_02040 [Ilumatobacteraceae bacterium]